MGQMTLAEARRIVRPINPQQGPTPTPPAGPPGTGRPGYTPPGGSPSAPTSGGGITGPSFDDAQGAAGSGRIPPGFYAVPGQPGYFYNPDTGEVGRLAGGGLVNTDPENPKSGTFYWDTLSERERKAFLAQTGGGSGGGSSSFDTGPGYLDLANRKFLTDEDQRRIENAQWDQVYRQNQETNDRSELGNRANAGFSMLDFQRGLANDLYQRSNDPGNFPALLAGYAGMEGGSPTPLSQLLGEGFKIEPIAGSNPMADPRFQQAVDDLYGYAGGVSADPPAVRAAYDKDAAAADLFFRQKPEDLERMFGSGVVKAATGADFITDKPTPMLVGEGGEPERVTVTPMRGMQWKGPGLPKAQNVQMNATPTAGVADGSYTPSEGTAVALGKALGPLGYPKEIIDTLSGGGIPGAPQFNPQVLERLKERNPSMYLLAMAAIRSRVGSSGLLDLMAESQRYKMGDFASTGGVIR